MTTYELLSAVSKRRENTTSGIVRQLGADPRDVARRLRRAADDDLIERVLDESRNVPAGIDRERWFLTRKGSAEWDRMDEERSE